MKPFPCVLLSVFLAQPGSLLFAADDPFAIELSVQADRQQKVTRGHPASAAPTAGVSGPVLTAKTRTRLKIRWSVVNQEEAGSIRDVTVHVVLDRDDAPGQSGGPRPRPDAIYESALLTDFAAQGRSTGDFVIDAPEPGAYRLRVETIGAAKARGTEFVAAIDLKVIP